MNGSAHTRLPEILQVHEADLLSEWISLQLKELGAGKRGADERQIRDQSREFLGAFQQALQQGDGASIAGAPWSDVRATLEQITTSRVNQGFTPSEVATFVLSFKQPLFMRIRQEHRDDPDALAEVTWSASTVLDKLGLYITEFYQKSRNEIILRQQEEMLELSTPVVQLWQGVLALPLIGTLDSARTQVVMQNLLEAIVRDGADIAIIDITGVPTVDTLVAQHLLKTVAAARLMGADCIISGIRPQIAQTIIHLGVDLSNVTTKATLADALATALRRKGARVVTATSSEAV
jgi:rsbT co-antagonist protein RsbR